MAAIVGAAGLPAALAAARAGKQVLLANKEALVMSGALFMKAVAEGNAQLLPTDSEHSAIFQSLPRGFACGRAGELERAGVRRILLTASGGPFRTTPADRLARVTPQQAIAHPNWVMGPKISVDSATMMNKGLEVIEAHWLFGAPLELIQVVVHPQSVIHSMVEYTDGSVIAQLGAPDMRTPIACALAFPERIESGPEPLDFTTLGALLMVLKIPRSAVGFGKARLVRPKGVDQTEWVVAAMPLGGYVKMPASREGEVLESEKPRAFDHKGVAARIFNVLAGPVANFLLAFALYWVLFVAGLPGVKPIIGDPSPNSPAAVAGLASGDTLLA